MTVTGAEQTQVTAAELASFTRQLGAMLDAGVNVLRALRIASQHSNNPLLMEASRSIARRLEDGREFHAAISFHPDVFDPFYVEMARQGETDGLLGKALLSVADYLDRVATQNSSPTTVHAPAHSSHAQPIGMIMAILGVQAVGAALIWGLATAQPEVLPLIWMGPLAALWVGVCLLSGAWILMRLRGKPAVVAAPATAVKLPPKSPERLVAETNGIVRNALLEQRDEQDERSLKSPPPAAETPKRAHNTNGKAAQNGRASADANLFEPEQDPPRFEL